MRLPLVCSPKHREPQSSWITRLAWENRCTPNALLEHCGLLELHRGETLLGLRPDGVARLSEATTIAPHTIDGLATRRLFENTGDVIDLEGSRQHWAGQIARAHVDVSSQRCCPQCLLERHGAMDERWLHRMSYCCPNHRLLLIRHPDLRRGLDIRHGPRRIGPPGTPGSTPAHGTQWPPLSAAIDFDELDEHATKTLQDILDGKSTRRNNQEINPYQTTRYLWATTLMLGRFIDAEDLPLDDTRRAAITSLASQRGGRGSGATIARKHPDRLAALVPSAWLLALGPDEARRDRLIDRVVVRVRDSDPRATKPHTYFPRLPLWLRAEMQHRLAETSQHRLKMVLRRTARPTRVVAANQLPQMLWPALFDERFADLLPGLTRQAARAFCAVALLRLDHCASIKEAELMLGQRGEPAINMTNLLHRLLPWTHKLEFGRALRTLSDDLEGELITDYAKLRKRFETQRQATPELAEQLVDALERQEALAPSDRTLLLAPTGRATLAAWTWENAVQCRFSRSAPHMAGLSIKKARPIYERLLEPNRDALLDRLEDILDTPLHEPALAPVAVTVR